MLGHTWFAIYNPCVQEWTGWTNLHNGNSAKSNQRTLHLGIFFSLEPVFLLFGVFGTFFLLEPVFLLFGADLKTNVSFVSATDGEAESHPSQFTTEGSTFLNYGSSIRFFTKAK